MSRGYVPPDGQLLTPYICPRRAAEAIDWYARIFGAVETTGRFVDADGRLGHANLSIDGAHLMVADAHPDHGAVAPPEASSAATYALSLYVEDVDATMSAAAAAGADVQTPPADQFHGSRMGTMIDPFGVRWMVGTHQREVSAEEMADAAARYAETAAPGAPRTEA